MLTIKTYFSGLEAIAPSKNGVSKLSKKPRHNAIATCVEIVSRTGSISSTIVVTSKSGSEFKIPMLTTVTNLLPIPDGMLIEIPFARGDSPKAKLARINGNEAKSMPQEYFYLSLTFHPLNNYRCLKISDQLMESNTYVS